MFFRIGQFNAQPDENSRPCERGRKTELIMIMWLMLPLLKCANGL